MKHSNDNDGEVTGNNTLQQPESLSKRVVRGGIWVFTLRITNRGLGFIRTIILARLLAPEDFGLIGIAMLAASTLASFSQTGLQSALIQKKDDIKTYLDVAWTTLAIRGIVLSAILFLSAPLIAEFFNSAQAELVIMVIAVNALIAGFGNIGIVFFQKDLQFKKQFTYEFSATIVDLAVSISLAFILRNVWALVWGGLAKNITRFCLSYILHSYKPRLSFSKDKFRDLFGYGIWISGSTILIFLITQGDDILVGRMLGVTALGFYQMAYLLSNLPSTEIADVISRVAFPAYSKLQNNLMKIREAYLKVLQVTAYVSIPLAGGILVLSFEFTKIFLGEKWLPMVSAISILALAGAIGSISATTRPIFHGIGKPKVDTTWQIIRLFVLAAVIYPLTIKWGISGTAIAVLISTFISAIGFSVMAIRITKCNLLSFGKMTVPPLLNTTVMIFTIMITKTAFECINLWHLLMLIGLGLTVYLFVTYLFEKLTNFGIAKIMKEIFSSL
ncbi:MAG: lipopolysaccharide biosynthesis protein [Deltaproteobacteria bacterium]|nr:lipopolysaccharide biosynthesis protein [Deltaproteobacteria bacterium]